MKNSPEANRRRVKEHLDRNRQFISEWKSNKGCQRCGEKNSVVLDCHHGNNDKNPILRNTKDNNHRGLLRLRPELIRVELEKCTILCANCHRIVHWEERQVE